MRLNLHHFHHFNQCSWTTVLLLSLFLYYQKNISINRTDIGVYVFLNWSMVAGFEELSRGILANQEQRNTLTSWKPRVTSWLSRLFLEYHSRLSKKARNILAFPSFSRLFRGKKAWKSRESQELLAFLCSPCRLFFFAGGCLFFEKMGLGALTERKVLKFNRCLCSGSNFMFFSLVRCYLN